jgi:DNA polymerase III sliding clamp (beta) subunit (PCNA family)
MSTATAPEPSATAAPTPPPSDAPKPVYAVGRLSVVVNRERLAEALSMAAAVANKRTNNPALACCRITTGENDIAVEATNMEAAVVTVITEVQIESAGAVLVSIDKLQQIVNEHSEDTLAISVEKDAFVIRGKESSFELFPGDLSKFPEIMPAADETPPGVELHASTLARLIRQAEPAIPRREKSGMQQGIRFESDGPTFAAAATDGSRVAVAQTTAPKDEPWPKLAMTFPAAAVQMLKGMLSLVGDEKVTLWAEGNRVFAEGGTFTLAHVMLEGKFPDFRWALKFANEGLGKVEVETEVEKDGKKQKVKEEVPWGIAVARDEIVAAVRKAKIVAKDDDSDGTILACQFNAAGIEFGASSSMFGTGTVRLPCKVRGGPLAIKLNPNFLLDALNATNAAEVRIDLPAVGNRAVVIRDGDTFTSLQMPVNKQ